MGKADAFLARISEDEPAPPANPFASVEEDVSNLEKAVGYLRSTYDSGDSNFMAAVSAVADHISKIQAKLAPPAPVEPQAEPGMEPGAEPGSSEPPPAA
jgi:hypothetical protein